MSDNVTVSKEERQLSQRQLKELLSYVPESGTFIALQGRGKLKPGTSLPNPTKARYLTIRLFGKRWMAHHVVWVYFNGVTPAGEVDHINGVRHDNRIENLRIATRTQNEYNKPPGKNNTSGTRGVFFLKGRNKWKVTIKCCLGCLFLGHFADKELAVLVRQEAERKYWGQFRREE